MCVCVCVCVVEGGVRTATESVRYFVKGPRVTTHTNKQIRREEDEGCVKGQNVEFVTFS